MLEKQRHHYLSVLGIDQYIPRRRLTGAPPSKLLLDCHLASSQSVTDKAAVSQSNQASTQTSMATDEYQQEDLRTNRHATVADQEITTKPLLPHYDALSKSQASPVQQKDVSSAPFSSTPLTFVLNTWRINNTCLVLDTHQPGSALPTRRLLQNILHAIGHGVMQLPPSETIRWPLFKNDQLANNPEQAQAMVQAYIGAQAGKSPLSLIILMGEAATQFSLNTDASATIEFESMQGSLIADSSWGAKVAITPSLHSLLQEPMTKVIAWQALQELIDN